MRSPACDVAPMATEEPVLLARLGVRGASDANVGLGGAAAVGAVGTRCPGSPSPLLAPGPRAPPFPPSLEGVGRERPLRGAAGERSPGAPRRGKNCGFVPRATPRWASHTCRNHPCVCGFCRKQARSPPRRKALILKAQSTPAIHLFNQGFWRGRGRSRR